MDKEYAKILAPCVVVPFESHLRSLSGYSWLVWNYLVIFIHFHGWKKCQFLDLTYFGGLFSASFAGGRELDIEVNHEIRFDQWKRMRHCQNDKGKLDAAAAEQFRPYSVNGNFHSLWKTIIKLQQILKINDEHKTVQFIPSVALLCLSHKFVSGKHALAACNASAYVMQGYKWNVGSH